MYLELRFSAKWPQVGQAQVSFPRLSQIGKDPQSRELRCTGEPAVISVWCDGEALLQDELLVVLKSIMGLKQILKKYTGDRFLKGKMISQCSLLMVVDANMQKIYTLNMVCTIWTLADHVNSCEKWCRQYTVCNRVCQPDLELLQMHDVCYKFEGESCKYHTPGDFFSGQVSWKHETLPVVRCLDRFPVSGFSVVRWKALICRSCQSFQDEL